METTTKIDPLLMKFLYQKRFYKEYAFPANRIKHNNLKASILRQERALLDKRVHKNHLILNPLGVIIYSKIN